MYIFINVWQIMQQNENFFEFTEKFLLEIAHQIYTCQVR